MAAYRNEDGVPLWYEGIASWLATDFLLELPG